MILKCLNSLNGFLHGIDPWMARSPKPVKRTYQRFHAWVMCKRLDLIYGFGDESGKLLRRAEALLKKHRR